MSKQMIVVDSQKGVESVETVVISVSDGVAAGELAVKTALPIRLLHESTKADVKGAVVPINYLDAILGVFSFECACGRRFNGPWDESRGEAIAHIERHHASETIKRDLDRLEATVEALIFPSPLFGWDELQEGN